MLENFGRRGLTALLDAFPNIVAYFYGHGHRNPEPEHWRDRADRAVLVQSGSVADFPQLGRMVQVYFDGVGGAAGNPLAGRVVSEYVQVKADREATNGGLLHSIFKASRKESEKEASGSAWRLIAHRLIPPIPAYKATRWDTFERKRPETDAAFTLGFADTCPAAEAVFGPRLVADALRFREALALPHLETRCKSPAAAQAAVP